MRKKISVVVSVYNEGEKLDKCLASLEWADEIIVMNNSSTDKTGEIAKKYTDKVYLQPNDPLRIDLQKNTGFEKALGDLILSVDADEQVSHELKKEILELLKKTSLKDGYFIPRINLIFGKKIEHSGWYPDYQMRLFKKGKGEFAGEKVHEGIKILGETDYLKGHISHDNYQTISQFIHKNMNIYAKNQANALYQSGYRIKPGDLIKTPFREFLSRYFAREGYKDGFHGLFLALLMASSHLVILAYVWEKESFKEFSQKNVMGDVQLQFNAMNKDLKSWFLSVKIAELKNPLKKLVFKLKGKFK